ncbi:MAG TPA: hypothetical protein VFQ67_16285 [Allosphingosinicella sp.]|nr:hypothetical protein [Allosphingosinicella sp.]
MTVESEIEAGKRLANWIGDQIDGLSLPSDLRTRVAAGFLHVALTHHASIIHLYDCQRYASAFALVRPAIDCFLRAWWVKLIATDEQVDGFLKGNDPPSSPRIASVLEQRGLFKERLKTVVDEVWAIVCDFTHGGGRMISRHMQADSVGPVFEEEELREVLGAANSWAMLAACSLADLSGDAELGERMVGRSEELN